jgi:hypothetical protein
VSHFWAIYGAAVFWRHTGAARQAAAWRPDLPRPPVPLNLAAPRKGQGVRILIRQGSEGLRYLGAGWHDPAPAFVWAVDEVSELTLPRPPGEGPWLLTLAAQPHLRNGAVKQRNVVVSANDLTIGQFAVSAKGFLACVIPADAMAGQAALRLRLRHSASGAPEVEHGQARRRAMAYTEILVEPFSARAAALVAHMRAVLGRPAAQRALYTAPTLPDDAARAEAAYILPGFQSAGDDCVFGTVQNHVGVMVLGLFRYSSIAITDLTRGIRTGFAGLGTPEHLEVRVFREVENGDFMGHETNYGMLYHTMRSPDKIDAATLKAQELKRLKMLARKFNEDIELGDHLFVVKSKAPVMPERVALLLEAMREKGPAKLLWVLPADAEHPAGAAEWAAPGLLMGYVDFIGNIQNICFASWFELCRSAHVLWKAGDPWDRAIRPEEPWSAL